ncbi:MAG: AAA family ATPase [Bryobacteraceae bacterium]
MSVRDARGGKTARRFLARARNDSEATVAARQGVTVGRRREISEIRAVLQATKENGGRLFCVSGEPGIGKTTLVETFLAGLVPGFNCHVATGRCSERLSGAEAYLPILEGLESLMCGASAEIVRNLLLEVAPSWYVQTTAFTSRSLPSAPLAADAVSASQERKNVNSSYYSNR